MPKRTSSSPKIVCLCGSTRFRKELDEAAVRETLAFHIVVRPEVTTTSLPHSVQETDPETKKMLDLLHFYKIDLADEVLFINVGGYMGPSTRREHEYAVAQGKIIRFLEA